MKTFLTIHYQPGNNWEQGKSIAEQDLRNHRTYPKQLSEEGKIALAGAFLQDDTGINILNVNNKEEAEKY